MLKRGLSFPSSHKIIPDSGGKLENVVGGCSLSLPPLSDRFLAGHKGSDDKSLSKFSRGIVVDTFLSHGLGNIVGMTWLAARGGLKGAA